MDFFDVFTSARFKTTQDGGRLFFLWGLRGSGYVIASEQDYERLRRQVKVSSMITLSVTILLAFAAKFFFKSDIVTFVTIIIASSLGRMLYAAWMRRLLPRLKVSDVKWPRQTWSAWLKELKPVGPWTVPDPPVTPAQRVSD